MQIPKHWLVYFLMWMIMSLNVIRATKTETPSTEKNEVNECKEKVSNVSGFLNTLSHTDLVAKVIEIEKTLHIQNERLNSQEKVNKMQDKNIVLLQSRAKDHQIERDAETMYKNPLSHGEVKIGNTVKKDDTARIKRQATPKFFRNITVSQLPPYPDNPDILYHRGNFLAEPTNCKDLKLIGHNINGFYSVKNISNNGNIESVFCNFTKLSQEQKEFDGKIQINKPQVFPFPDNKDILYRRGNFLAEPANCADLRLIGHYLNGFYSVKNPESKGNIDTVFCNFTKTWKELQEVSAKISLNKHYSTSAVHFHVQRQTPRKTQGVVPFEIEKLNVGGAMDWSSGIFTTPKSGIYHFALSGIKDSDSGDTYVELLRNVSDKSEIMAVAYADNSSSYGSLGFTATVRIQKGDVITLSIGKGALYDSSYYSYTSFTGSLLMEED